jgi:hypothetical protein
VEKKVVDELGRDISGRSGEIVFALSFRCGISLLQGSDTIIECGDPF